ncbi:MAG: hypothetical protein ACJA2Z_000470 [Candidatus Paceibacteria bacterium]|jgi:hypothetical protein
MNALGDEGVSIGTFGNKIKDSNNLIRSAF